MFPSFLFGPLPKIKSLEISKSFLLLNVINEFMSSINFDEGKLEWNRKLQWALKKDLNNKLFINNSNK